MQHPWYQERWGDIFQLTGDQNVKMRFDNNRQGYRLATSVGGSITGEGGDRLILDDPHNVQEAGSEVIRQGTLEWIDASWATRGNDPKTVAKVVVMQRVHEVDATAHLLAKGEWEHLCLPAEYEPKAYVTGIGWSDPRKVDGELLWPKRFGRPELEKLKRDLGDYAYAGQFQQRPYPRGGGMFNVAKLRERIVKHRPTTVIRGRGWDMAASTKRDSKRTAGVLMSKDYEKRLYIEHVVLGKWKPDERNAIMLNAGVQDTKAVNVIVEQEGGSSGIDQANAITKMFMGYHIEFVKVTGDKVTRADAVAAQINGGNIYIVDDGTWNVEAFLSELEAFPNGEYKDQVDALSLAFNWIADKKSPTPISKPKMKEGWREEFEAMNPTKDMWPK